MRTTESLEDPEGGADEALRPSEVELGTGYARAIALLKGTASSSRTVLPTRRSGVSTAGLDAESAIVGGGLGDFLSNFGTTTQADGTQLRNLSYTEAPRKETYFQHAQCATPPPSPTSRAPLLNRFLAGEWRTDGDWECQVPRPRGPRGGEYSPWQRQRRGD